MSDEASVEKQTDNQAEPERATVPSFRLKEEADKRRAAEQSQSALAERVKELQAELEKATNQIKSIESNHSQDLALMGLGVNDSEIREFVRSRFAKAENETPFEEWLSAQRENPSPILAPFLSKPEPKAEPKDEPKAEPEMKELTSAPEKQRPNGNPNAGTAQPANGSGQPWKRDDIQAAIAQNGGRLGANKDAILKALAAEGLIKPPRA